MHLLPWVKCATHMHAQILRMYALSRASLHLTTSLGKHVAMYEHEVYGISLQSHPLLHNICRMLLP